jgi:hypothetical protein
MGVVCGPPSDSRIGVQPEWLRGIIIQVFVFKVCNETIFRSLLRELYLERTLRKVSFVLAVFITVMFAVSASAETDGFKAYLGYGFSSGETKSKWSENWPNGLYYSAGEDKYTGANHGVSSDLRYQGANPLPLWGRVTFEYGWITGGRHEYNCRDNFDLYSWSGRPKTKGNIWQVEGDIGYRVYSVPVSGGVFDITPYLGLGYREKNVEHWDGSGEKDSLQAPYAAFGGVFSYNTPAWGIGLDTAFIMPFATDFTYAISASQEFSYKSDIGYGVRVQLPVTVALIRPKTGSLGVSVFATPYYEYIDHGRSNQLNLYDPVYGMHSASNRVTDSRYGLKAGIGLSF